MKLYPTQDPKIAGEKKENKEIETLSEQILAIRKAEYFQGKFDIIISQQGFKKKHYNDFNFELLESDDKPSKSRIYS